METNVISLKVSASYAVVIQLLYHQGGLESVAECLVPTHCVW